MTAVDLITADLFADAAAAQSLAPGAMWLRGAASPVVPALWRDLNGVIAQSGFRNMVTPGGRRMSVAMSNCGDLGWVSDASGYRYTGTDPQSGQAWPRMPASFRQLARRAAERAGFVAFEPDACLINRYVPGARLSLHQDRDESDLSQPVVSVSLGLSAVFLFGGLARAERSARIPLRHGDVVVWGGASRLRYHGVLPLAPGEHALCGAQRINLTFRRAR